ncbi:hypothetical protein P8452_55943 [Trifolium repens]|nr:hypothetical protein P8452_55943 [Trifolium repens]
MSHECKQGETNCYAREEKEPDFAKLNPAISSRTGVGIGPSYNHHQYIPQPCETDDDCYKHDNYIITCIDRLCQVDPTKPLDS